MSSNTQEIRFFSFFTETSEMSMEDSVFNEPTKMLLQKNKEYKKTLFESGSQSFIIATKRFVQVKSFTTATEN